MDWSDLDDVDEWSAAPDDPPRRDPVKTMLLGRGLTLVTVDAEEMR